LTLPRFTVEGSATRKANKQIGKFADAQIINSANKQTCPPKEDQQISKSANKQTCPPKEDQQISKSANQQTCPADKSTGQQS